MKKIVKFIVLGIIVLAAAGGAFYSATAPVAVPLTPVAAKDVELSFTEQGLAVADSVVQVYPLAQGQVVSVDVAEGQTVAEGDVLCVIDDAPLIAEQEQLRSVSLGYQAQIENLDAEQGKMRSELQTSRRRLEAELAALEAQERSAGLSLETQNITVEEKLRLQNIIIEQGEEDHRRALDELEKAGALFLAGSMPKAEHDAAADAAAKAESALEAARLELSLIEGGRGVSSADYYSGAKAALAAQIDGVNRSLANDSTEAMKSYYMTLMQGNDAAVGRIGDSIADCTVTAPASGVVTKLNVKDANVASASAPVAEITAPGENMIEVFVATEDIDSVKPGDAVGLTLKRREGDAEFTGEVTEIGTAAEVRLSTLGVEERKVKVRVRPHLWQLSDVSFGVGYSVDVEFFVYRASGQLAVPKTALYKDGEKDMLWAVRGGRALAVEVRTGRELRTETVITGGLQEGDYVVTDADNDALKDGAKVKDEE